MQIRNLLRKNIRKLNAYSAKEVPCRVKLDANESPYSFPFLLEAMRGIPTNRYPDPEGRELRRAAAKHWKTTPEQILLGNGSDELIHYLITTFGGPVLFPHPTFSMYGIIADAADEERAGIPLDCNFDIDEDEMLRAVKTYKPRLLFLSTPNNPTGNCFSPDRIRRLIEASKGIVVIDEAYQPFGNGTDMISLIGEFENVTIMRTLSKVGFASLRVGFLIAGVDIIEAVNRVRLPFNVNALSQVIAVNLFRNYRDIEKSIRIICRERDNLFKALKEIPGVRPYPSEANFILFKVRNASVVHKRLLSRGILIKDMTPVMKDCMRVTVGTPEENGIFLETLKKTI